MMRMSALARATARISAAAGCHRAVSSTAAVRGAQRQFKTRGVYVGEVVKLATAVVSRRHEFEYIVFCGGRGYGDAAKVLGWRPGLTIAAACTELIDLSELVTEFEDAAPEGAPHSDEDEQFVGELHDAVLTGLQQLRDVLDDASGGTLDDFGADGGDDPMAGFGRGGVSSAGGGDDPSSLFDSGPTELTPLLQELAVAVIAADPVPKCHHQWSTLSGSGKGAGTARVHNRADGGGKYVLYKCTLCSKIQRRYGDTRQ
jgi:hypothetical protein